MPQKKNGDNGITGLVFAILTAPLLLSLPAKEPIYDHPEAANDDGIKTSIS